MVPFRLSIAAVTTPPFPSNVSVPTPTNGRAMGGGAVSNPLAVCTKVPFSIALEHPLLSAFAAGAMPRASAATAAIAKIFSMVLRFMIISFVFISCLAPFRFPEQFHLGKRRFLFRRYFGDEQILPGVHICLHRRRRRMLCESAHPTGKFFQ